MNIKKLNEELDRLLNEDTEKLEPNELQNFLNNLKSSYRMTLKPKSWNSTNRKKYIYRLDFGYFENDPIFEYTDKYDSFAVNRIEVNIIDTEIKIQRSISWFGMPNPVNLDELIISNQDIKSGKITKDYLTNELLSNVSKPEIQDEFAKIKNKTYNSRLERLHNALIKGDRSAVITVLHAENPQLLKGDLREPAEYLLNRVRRGESPEEVAKSGMQGI